MLQNTTLIMIINPLVNGLAGVAGVTGAISGKTSLHCFEKDGLYISCNAK